MRALDRLKTGDNRRVIAVALAVLIVFGALPAPVAADSTSGGSDGVNWKVSTSVNPVEVETYNGDIYVLGNKNGNTYLQRYASDGTQKYNVTLSEVETSAQKLVVEADAAYVLESADSASNPTGLAVYRVSDGANIYSTDVMGNPDSITVNPATAEAFVGGDTDTDGSYEGELVNVNTSGGVEWRKTGQPRYDSLAFQEDDDVIVGGGATGSMSDPSQWMSTYTTGGSLIQSESTEGYHELQTVGVNVFAVNNDGVDVYDSRDLTNTADNVYNSSTGNNTLDITVNPTTGRWGVTYEDKDYGCGNDDCVSGEATHVIEYYDGNTELTYERGSTNHDITDAAYAESQSSPIYTLTEGGTLIAVDTNTAPSVTITDPSDGADLQQGAEEPVSVTANISDPAGGNITVRWAVYNETTGTFERQESKTVSTTPGENTTVSADIDPQPGDNEVLVTADDGRETNTKSVQFTIGNKQPLITGIHPESGAYERDGDVTLEADVTDPDGSAPLNVTFYAVNATGAKKHQIATTQEVSGGNGTASVSWSPPPGGGYWMVEVESQWNASHTDSAGIYAVRTPGQITVVDGSGTVVTDETANITLTAYQSNYDYRMTWSENDGRVTPYGVPDTEVRVEVEAANYTSASGVIPNPAANTTVVVYDSSRSDIYEQCFELSSDSIYDPEDSWVVLKEYIDKDGDGDKEWTPVTGAFVTPANAACMQVEDGTDYHVVVNSLDGAAREHGMFTGDSSRGMVTLRVTGDSSGEPQANGLRYDAEIVEESGQKYIEFTFNDSAEKTRDIDVSIHKRGNSTAATTLGETSYATAGEFTYKVPITENQTSEQWVVEMTATRQGESVHIIEPVGGDSGIDIPLDPAILGSLALVLVGFVAALYSGSPTVGAIVLVAITGALGVAGLWVVPISAWWVATVIAVGGYLRRINAI